MAEMISLYLDEDVSVLVGEMMKARGFDVQTTRDADRLGADDETQLSFSAISGRIILTHNRIDFERLAIEYFEAGGNHSGIIIAVRRLPREMVIRVLSTLSGLAPSDMVNQIRYI